MIAALDLGNSRAKLFYVGRPQPTVFSYDDIWPGALLRELDDARGELPIRLGISSVNPAAYDALAAAWPQDTEDEMIDARRLLVLHSPVDFGSVTGMGDDRKLGLIGALIVGPPPLITVDCGTAITINTVDAAAVCRGGAIMPGFDTQLRALHDYTGQLPRLTAHNTNLWQGATTEQAMLVGVIRGTTGAVASICRRIQASMPAAPTIFITGGGAELLYAQLQEHQLKTRLLPDLVGAGLLALLQASTR